jgi:hypothetical protein
MDRRTLFVDVDDTLIIHDKSKFPPEFHISVPCNGRVFVGVPHSKNILMLKKFHALGYDIHVWSKTGWSWAKAVVEKLGIQDYVESYLTKPDFYLDDKEASEWMGPRVYREIKPD